MTNHSGPRGRWRWFSLARPGAEKLGALPEVLRGAGRPASRASGLTRHPPGVAYRCCAHMGRDGWLTSSTLFAAGTPSSARNRRAQIAVSSACETPTADRMRTSGSDHPVRRMPETRSRVHDHLFLSHFLLPAAIRTSQQKVANYHYTRRECTLHFWRQLIGDLSAIGVRTPATTSQQEVWKTRASSANVQKAPAACGVRKPGWESRRWSRVGQTPVRGSSARIATDNGPRVTANAMLFGVTANDALGVTANDALGVTANDALSVVSPPTMLLGVTANDVLRCHRQRCS